MKEIKIKTYSDIYKHQVASLIVDIQNREFGIPISLEQQTDLKDIPGFYQIANGNFWIAFEDENIIGTIALLDIGNHQCALRKMFVHSKYRGKEFGAGQKLLNTLLAWATLKKFKAIYLGTTEKFVAAHRFYEKNGFKPIEKKLLPEKFPIMAVDVKFYTCLLGKP